MAKEPPQDDRQWNLHLRNSDAPTKRTFLNLGRGLFAQWEVTGRITLQTRIRREGDRNPRRITLGEFPGLTIVQARAEIAAAQRKVQAGEDPELERRRHKKNIPDLPATLYQLVAAYLERRALGLGTKDGIAVKTLKQERELLDVLKVRLGDRLLNDIAPSDIGQAVSTYLVAIRKQGGTGSNANKLLAITRRMFRTSRGWGLISLPDPTDGLKKPVREQPRERILFDPKLLSDPLDVQKNELGILVAALRQDASIPAKEDARDAIHLVLLLGLRALEVAGLEWRGLNLEGSIPTLTITQSKTKAGLRTLPLPPQAKTILEQVRARRDLEISMRMRRPGDETSGFIFPAREDATRQPHIHPESITRALVRILTHLKLAQATLHDLRRTMLSGIAELGFDNLAGRIAGHEGDTVTKRVYDRSRQIPAMYTAINAWVDHLNSIEIL